MKTAHKIAVAQALYYVIRTCRRVIGKDDRTAVTRRGIRYSLDLSEAIDLAIFVQGQFEQSTADACTRYVKPGQTVLDIGANIGAHTLHLAKLVGPTGRVLAFEPTQYAHEKLMRNLALNPDLARPVSAYQCFLGKADHAQIMDAIYSSWPLTGGEALHVKHRGQPMPTNGAGMRRLDSVLSELGNPRVDFVKMDVDGFECEVLAGARRLLATDRPTFIMELAPYVLEERGSSIDQLLGFFLPSGYKFYRESDESSLPDDPKTLAALVGDGASINVIARPT